MTYEEKSEAFKARIDAGEKIEAGDWMPDEYRQAALKFGIIDKPGGLKQHVEPVPYLGGLAVYLSFLLATGFVHQYSREVLGILLAGKCLALVMGGHLH